MYYPLSQLQYLLVRQNETVEHCLHILDNGLRPTLFVVNDDNALLGTVSDGDIRRALLKGLQITDAINRAMNTRFVYAMESEEHQLRLNRLKDRDVSLLPVLDVDQKILGFEADDENRNVLAHTAVLMCGGLGTRMGELTQNCPKPMLPIGETPMLEKILRRLVRQGIRNFYFAINYLGEIIEDYFGDGKKWGAHIQYLRETKRLGTGGALSLIRQRPAEAMLVMNGDILTDFDMRNMFNFHLQYNSFATMGIVTYQYENPFGVVCHDGRTFLEIKEKPVQSCEINSGIYIVDPAIIDFVPEDEFIDMPDILVNTKNAGKAVNVFPILESWADIGRKGDYLKLQES